MNEFFKASEFAIETVTTGSFLDEGESGKTYQIEVAVIRMNRVALTEWQNAKEYYWRNDFDTEEEWRFHHSLRVAAMDVFEQKVKKELGWTDRDASFNLTWNVNEIFTTVRIWRDEDENVPGRS